MNQLTNCLVVLTVFVFLFADAHPTDQDSGVVDHVGSMTVPVVEGRKLYSYDKHPSINSYKKSEKMQSTDTSSSSSSSSGAPSTTAVLHQLDWKTLISTAMKIFLGGNDEQSKQASKQMVDMIVSLIDGLRLSFTMRKAQARSGGQDGPVPTTDAALAGLSMLKAYVKTVASKDEQCIKKYLCQANREAVRDGNKVGYMVAQFGSYATSYMLENFHLARFEDNFNASQEGRNGANCEEVFQQCNELQ